VTTDDHEPVLRRAPAERERLAEVIADRLDGQVIFLALPFLRFARIVARLRLRPIVRAGRVVSSTVRGTRIAGRELTSRAAWLLTGRRQHGRGSRRCRGSTLAAPRDGPWPR